jgi:beta-N-acetylhexosaminidase
VPSLSFLRPLAAAFVLLAIVAPASAETLEQMAGQMIIVGFAGDDVSDKSVTAVRDEIASGLLGGVMYLKSNVASLKRVKAMNAAFRAASPTLPPFLSLDQEGGAVERLTSDVGFSEEPTARAVAARDTPAEAGALYLGMARSIAALGFTLNLGPVVDLNLNPRNQIIAKFGRAFSADPETVSAYAAAFIRAHHDAGLLTALKHFPGHGSSTGDSHQALVDITRTWSASELDPYRTLISDGLVDMVMVGHLFNGTGAPDEGRRPASLSPHWVGDVLRGDLGFDGVVISDDLGMGAIRQHYDLHDAVVGAVRAGVDVLLFTNTAAYDPGLAGKVRAILVAEANADPDFAARIEQSYARIVALRRRIAD